MKFTFRRIVLMFSTRPDGRSLTKLRSCWARTGVPIVGSFASLLMVSACGQSALHADDAQWTPRPLILPATTPSQTPWQPPVKAVAAEQTPTTIVIQAPTPPPVVETPKPPTAAENRQRLLAEKRIAEKLAQDFQSSQHATRQLPPSDRINSGARKAQLAETAVNQLRTAYWASQRGATESARRAATDTLRTIASLRDSEFGGNSHTRRLNESLIAIQESGDFAGRFGPVDQDAIGRLIEVHQTSTLKHTHTSDLTSARAIEAYLKFAKTCLVEASQGGPLAAEAALILAKLETSNLHSLTSPASDHDSKLHAGELALMYRRAAVEIDPSHAGAAAELGRTLLKRSLPVPAKDTLVRSVRMSPTRQSVQDLMKAASQSGDFAIVQQCEQRLKQSSLPSELPYQFLSPQAFAKTGQTHPVEPVPVQAYAGQPRRAGTRPVPPTQATPNIPRISTAPATRLVEPSSLAPVHSSNTRRSAFGGLFW